MTALPRLRKPLRVARQLLLQFPVFLGCLLGAQAFAAWSTAEFLATEPQWEKFAREETQIIVEGRIAQAGGRLMRLQQCSVSFRPRQGELQVPPRGSDHVSVAGTLDKQGDRWVFLVDRITVLPNDAATYALRKTAIDKNDPEDWKELANWAETRGSFYKDQMLLQESKENRRTALLLEYQQEIRNPARLDQLAEQADKWGFADLVLRFHHAALRQKWADLRDRASLTDADYQNLLAEVIRQLTSAGTPLPELPAKLAEEYSAKPLETYENAVAAERVMLHRLFYGEIKSHQIVRGTDPDGRNGLEVAARLQTSLPEWTAQAKSYRNRGFDYRLAHVTTESQTELMGLVQELERHGRKADAERARKIWLAAREALLREDGLPGLIRAAEDYVSVMRDKASAIRLLLEADQRYPNSELVANQLTALGYVKRDGKWMSAGEAAELPVDPLTEAMQAGRVTSGMSPEQVRKTLGAPDHVVRSVSLSQVYEAWIYGEPGRSGVTVHFLRYVARDRSGSRVVRITSPGR